MKRVLVCVAERHVARLIEVNLTRQGHVVHSCFQIETVRESLSKEKFDLLVVDPDLPENGMQAVKIMVATDPLHSEVPIFVLGEGILPQF